MKTSINFARTLKFHILAAFLVAGLVALHIAHGQQPQSAPSDSACAAWVQKCLKDFQAIKPGMTRADVESRLRVEGGFGVGPGGGRYLHPACHLFKVDVQFDFKRNTNDQNRAVFGKDDKVTGISKPYLDEVSIND